MRLTLVVPGLLARPREVLARSGALSVLAGRARVERASDADTALLGVLRLDAAVAPLAALGAGADVGSRWFARADPVSMSVGRDDVRIVGRVDDLDDAEVHSLLALLGGHFAADGLAFEAPRRDTWFVASERPFDLRATPLDASLQQPLRDRLPAGRDAPAWRRWLTEAQMLLHEHPLAARASHPVDGLWFSQAGVLPSGANVAPLAPLAVHVADVRAAAVARGLAKLAGRAPHSLSTLDRALAEPADCIVVTMAADSIDAFDGVVSNFVVPALDALDAKRIDVLAVVADGDGAAGTWWPERRRWRDRLRRRVGSFALPEDAR